MSAGGKVIELFGPAVVQRVMPPVTEPKTLGEFADASALRMAREERARKLGTVVAVGAGIFSLLLVLDWKRGGSRSKK